MDAKLSDFARLLAPLSEDEFLTGTYHRRPLHVPGTPDKIAATFSWGALNDLLAMDVWDPNTLQLVLDRQRVPAGNYSRTAVNRGKRQIMQPDSEKVLALLRQGASLVLNNIETLHGGVLAAAEAIAVRFGAKVSANLYCSWQAQQAFDSHYDRHDVYVLQIAGEKAWNIYEGRMDYPIEHPAFYGESQAECDRMKGRVGAKLTMRPGDLLYLPRGQFHDALASSEASLHLTFGCSEPTGLDWLTRLWERALTDPAYRADLPQGEAELRAHLQDLVERFRHMALDDQSLAAAKDLRQSLALKRSTFDLPEM